MESKKLKKKGKTNKQTSKIKTKQGIKQRNFKGINRVHWCTN
jgi:hypothetical protein